MKQFRYAILLIVCTALLYGILAIFLQLDAVQEVVLLPTPIVEQGVVQNLPTVAPAAHRAVAPATPVATPVTPALAPSVAQQVSKPTPVIVSTASSSTTRSVAGGVAHYVAPVVPNVANRQQTVSTAYAYVATPQHSSSPTSVVTQSSALPQRAPQHRAPGTIGSTWEEWLNDYYGSTGKAEGDLSGLENWWNTNFGGGFTPDGAYNDFYDWAHSKYAPLSDGVLPLLFCLLMYALLGRKRSRFNYTKSVD